MNSSEPLTSGSDSVDESSNDIQALAQFSFDLDYDDLNPPVKQQTQLVLRDTLGTMLAGAALPEVRAIGNQVETLGGPGGATVIGQSSSTSPHFAALVNGTGGVSLELDEGSQFAINHPAIHILPAAMALAEDTKSTGEEFLAALLVGYEVAVRVGRATKLRNAVHPFGTHAIVGAAAACARLLGMNVAQVGESMALAAGLTIASSQTAANAGASVRNLFTGFTNHNAILATRLVQAGFTAEPEALGSVFGGVLGEQYRPGQTADLGETFYIERNYFKLYACSRWNHAPIEAAAAIQASMEFELADVESITVWTYDPATRLNWQRPVNGYAAKHSIPYSVAARIVLGSNDLEAYSDKAVTDPEVRAMAQRIEVKEDPSFTAMLPDVRPARVEIELGSGEKLQETVERPRGGYDRPLSEDELANKFRRLAGMVLPPGSVNELTTLLPELKNESDLEPLSRLLRTGNPPQKSGE